MKRLSILYIATFLFGGLALNAQSQKCELPLMVLIPEQAEDVPSAARSYLANTLTKVAVDNGLAASGDYAQFLITPQFSVLSKQILPGPPRSFIYEFDITLYIGDYLGEKVFASTSKTIKGVGENETKAYINAVRNINPKAQDIQSFVSEGKNKIITYYDNNYQTIIKKAQALATQKQFEEAMFYLMAVPECSRGFEATMKVAGTVYQQYIDDLCNRNFARARAVWAAQQNRDGAAEAGEYLSYIYPDAKCYGDAMALHREIKSRIGEEWDFVMRYYNDQVSLEQQRINAWKEVGVAYGRNQQPVTTSVYWLPR